MGPAHSARLDIGIVRKAAVTLGVVRALKRC